jgi:hypothetical protein
VNVKYKLKRHHGVGACAVIAMSIAGCAQIASLANALLGRRPQEQLCGATDGALAAERGYDSTTVKFAMANGYYGWCIPEYDDDQRLSDGNLRNRDYGPVAHVLAAPWLDTLQVGQDFVQVAILAVESEATPAPATYSQLGLSELNCIYLRQPAGGTEFEAAIVKPVDSGGIRCPATVASTGGPPLMVVSEQPFGTDLRNYPPVTRFIEGGDGQTFIGVRCGNRWCAIHGANVEGAIAKLPPSAHDGTPGLSYPQAVVKGWFDDQVLGIPDGQPTHKIHRTIRASAVPDPNLGKLTLSDFIGTTAPDDYKTVGRTYFPDEPPTTSKYAKLFGFSKGINIVGMRAEVHSADTVWYTRVINAKSDTTVRIPTRRMDHSKYFAAVYGSHATIPATMRWRWSDEDEDLWYECLGGCCLAGK